jgi:hypothetical protein
MVFESGFVFLGHDTQKAPRVGYHFCLPHDPLGGSEEGKNGTMMGEVHGVGGRERPDRTRLTNSPIEGVASIPTRG